MMMEKKIVKKVDNVVHQKIPKLLLMIAFMGGLTYYLGWHGMRFLFQWLPTSLEPLFWILLMVISLGYPIGFFFRAKSVAPIGRFFQVVSFYYMGIIPYLVILLLVTDGVGLILRLFGVEMTNYTTISGIVLITLVTISTVKGMYNARNHYVRSHEVVVEKTSAQMSKLKIVAVSDIHLGYIVGNIQLRKMVKEINDLKPDVIFLVGDVIDHDIEPFIRNKMSENLGQLKAKLGTYAVLGNHEYYGGHIDVYSDEMASVGIPVLMDEVVELADSIYLVGRKDLAARSHGGARKEITSLTAGLDRSKPIIVLDHQPMEFDKDVEAGADMVFCGHTHRGQIAPLHYITKRMYEVDWGYVLKESLHIFVSSGYGTWGPPMRTGSQSEIMEIDVEFVASEKA